MNRQGLTLDFQYRFEAAHRLTSSESVKCQTPHGHTWMIQAIYGAHPQMKLGPSAMAAEFSQLKKGLKEFVEQTADHSFFVNWKDPLYIVSREIAPKMRSLEFPCDPTTEAIAGGFALKLMTMHQTLDLEVKANIQLVGIRIQETPTNAIEVFWGYDGALPIWLTTVFEGYLGWWSEPDPLDRSTVSVVDRHL